jgi:sugar phosphate isomerase/epimerase
VHLPYARFAEDLDGIRREAAALETVDVVCPSLPNALRTPEGIVHAREVLRAAAERLADTGLRLSYHNHDYEFALGDVDGHPDALAYLLDPGEDGRIWAEFDVYWLAHGGQDPVGYMTPYRGRVSILHLKDMTPEPDRTFAAVGTGTLDFPAILRAGLTLGVEWYAVEQDQCPGDPLESLAVSWRNLQAMLPALT